MNLRDPYLILALLPRVVHGNASRISLLVASHHAVLLNVETLVEKNVAVYLLDDVILHQDQTIYLYVNCKTVRVETG